MSQETDAVCLGLHTMDTGCETVMKVVHLQLAGAHSLTDRLLPTLGGGQAHISPHLHKPLL